LGREIPAAAAAAAHKQAKTEVRSYVYDMRLAGCLPKDIKTCGIQRNSLKYINIFLLLRPNGPKERGEICSTSSGVDADMAPGVRKIFTTGANAVRGPENRFSSPQRRKICTPSSLSKKYQ
jgi:hypothetical protein